MTPDGLPLIEAAPEIEGLVIAVVLSVPEGPSDSSKALGFTKAQGMRQVVMPLATRIIVPPLGKSVIGLLKNASVTSVISMEELLRRTQTLIQKKSLVLKIGLPRRNPSYRRRARWVASWSGRRWSRAGR